MHQCFKPLYEWAQVADQVSGEALPYGHYIAEEAPDLLLARVRLLLTWATNPLSAIKELSVPPARPTRRWPRFGCCHTSQCWASGRRKQPGARAVRTAGTGCVHRAECTARRPACPQACRGWGWKSRVQCSRHHSQGGSSKARLFAMKRIIQYQ